MQAAMEQTTVDPVLPSTTYDHANKLINAWVSVSLPEGAVELRVFASPDILIPASGTSEPAVWTVLWNIQTDPATLASASFQSLAEGVQIPGLTSGLSAGVGLRASGALPGLSQWSTTIENSVQGTFPVEVKYDLLVKGTPLQTSVVQVFRTHDPTIVVTPAPIDGGS